MFRRPTTGKKRKKKGPSAAKLLEATRIELEGEKLARQKVEEEFMETSARLTGTIENLRQLVHKQQTITNDLHEAREKQLKIALSEARAKLAILEQTRIESLENEAVVKALEKERASLLQQIAEVVNSREEAEKEHAAEVAALHISTNSLKARLQEIFRDSLQDAIDDEKKRIEAELSLDAEAALAEVGQLRNLTSQQARQINHYRVIMDRKKIECDRLHRLIAKLCKKIEKQHETMARLREYIADARLHSSIDPQSTNGTRLTGDLAPAGTQFLNSRPPSRPTSRPTSAFNRSISRPQTPLGVRNTSRGAVTSTHDDRVTPFSEEELQALMRKLSSDADDEDFTDEQLWDEILWAKDARHSDAWSRVQDLDTTERKRRESLRHPPSQSRVTSAGTNSTNTPRKGGGGGTVGESQQRQRPFISIAQQSGQENMRDYESKTEDHDDGRDDDDDDDDDDDGDDDMVPYIDRTIRPSSAARDIDTPASPSSPPPPTNLRPTVNAVNPYNRLSSESERALHIPLHPLQGASDASTYRTLSRPSSAASTRPYSSYSSRSALSHSRVSSGQRPVSALVNTHSSDSKRKAAYNAMRKTVQSAQAPRVASGAQQTQTSEADVVRSILYSDKDIHELEATRLGSAAANRPTVHSLPARPATASAVPSLRQGLLGPGSLPPSRPASSRFNLSREGPSSSGLASSNGNRPLSALNTSVERVERTPVKSQKYYDILGATSGILMTG